MIYALTARPTFARARVYPVLFVPCLALRGMWSPQMALSSICSAQGFHIWAGCGHVGMWAVGQIFALIRSRAFRLIMWPLCVSF